MSKKLYLLLLMSLVAAVSFVQAQKIPNTPYEIIDSRSIKHVCKLPPTNTNAHFFVQSSQEVLDRIKTKEQSDFQVDYISSCGGEQWPQEAVTAFEFALSIWSDHVSSDVPIKVIANWAELEGQTLGSARPSQLVQISGTGEPDTWYTLAQLSALTGQPIREQLDDIEHDIDMNIQCDFDDWYFGTDAEVPENRSDFVTVVLHEIGHGLGFLGSMSADNDTETAEWGIGSETKNPLIYDRFTVDEGFNTLIDETSYPNPSSDLYDALVGVTGGVFFNGTNANTTLMNQRVNRAKLYTPDPFNEGSSYSHFDQTAFRQSVNALMLPFIDRTFALHSPGPLFCGLLSDIGWPLGDGCIGLIQSGILVTDKTELRFGVLNAGESNEMKVSISNREDAEATLTGSLELDSNQFSISGNSGFTFSLEPGTTKEYAIRYEPTTNERHEASLSIEHNGSNLPSPYFISLEGESIDSGKLVKLDQSYPNPFVVNNNHNADSPIIEFAISERARVKMDLYSISGQYLRPIIDKDLNARRYAEKVDMDGLASGIYIYRIVVNGSVQSRKLMYVR